MGIALLRFRNARNDGNKMIRSHTAPYVIARRRNDDEAISSLERNGTFKQLVHSFDSELLRASQ